MKVTYLLADTHPWGGVKIIFEQANRLMERGHEVNIVSRQGQPSWFPLMPQVIRVSRFTDRNIPPSDLVIGTFYTTVLPAYQSRRGIPVHFCQGYEGFHTRNYTRIPLLRPLVKKVIDRVYSLETVKVVISPLLRDLIRNRFKQSSYLMPNGIDLTAFYPEQPRIEKVVPATRVLVVGPTGVRAKGIFTALMAVKLVKKRGYRVELVRVSQFPLGKKERSLDVTDEYHFKVSPKLMPAIYRSCDIFIDPSIVAPFSLPAIEAMASGLPCLLTDIEAFRGYDEKEDYAFFVPPNDPVKMAEGLMEMIEDKNRRDGLREKGLKVASNFDWDRAIEIVEDTFTRIHEDKREEYEIR